MAKATAAKKEAPRKPDARGKGAKAAKAARRSGAKVRDNAAATAAAKKIAARTVATRAEPKRGKQSAASKSAVSKSAASKRAVSKSAASKRAAPKRAAAKPAGPGKVATKVGRVAPAKPSGTSAKTRRAPTKKQTADKVAAKTRAQKALAPKKTAGKQTAPAAKKVANAPAAKKVAKAPAAKKLPKGVVICPLSGIHVSPQKPNIAPKTLERLHEQLLEERARHLHQATELEAEADALANEREPGDTQFDEESGEGDTMNIERERDLMLSATARSAVDEIDRALARMKNGTFGLCTPAGRRISLARLEAIPWAELCVDCKARGERRR